MVKITPTIQNLPRFQTEHHNGRKFRNIWGTHPDSDAMKYDAASGDIRYPALDVAGWILRKGMGHERTGRPADVHKLTTEEVNSPSAAPHVFWLGHATCLLQVDGLNILTDPVFAERVSPVKFVGPRRLCEVPLHRTALPAIDAICLSHNHYDHAEITTLRFLAKRDQPAIFVPLRVAALVKQMGFRNVYELDWWQRIEMQNFAVTCLPSKHFSGRSATDRNETLWSSQLIEFHKSGKTVYFAGDTAYSPHFTEIAEEFPSIDLTLMPIGAYLPRWFMREVHVSPAEAVTAFCELKAKKMLAIHWGTYDLGDEEIDQPAKEARLEANRHGISSDTLKIIDAGGSFEF